MKGDIVGFRRGRDLNCVAMIVLVMALAVASLNFKCGQVTGPEGQQQPLIHKIAVWNDLLAAVNRTLAETAIDLNKAGILEDQVTGQILTESKRIAEVDNEVVALLQSTTELDLKTAQKLKDLLDQIAASAQGLVETGNVGIKNAEVQQRVLGIVSTIVGTASEIVAELERQGVLK